MNVLTNFSLTQFPVIMVWIIGLILSFVFWRRHPKVSLLAFIAILGFLIVTFADAYLTSKILNSDLPFAKMGVLNTFKYLVVSLVFAVLWVLLGAAIFGWRGEQQPIMEGAAVAKSGSKIDRVGMASLILSILLILIILGTKIIFIQTGQSILASSGDTYHFWTGVFGAMSNTYYFSLWALPLGILNIIMAFIARKTDNAAQKKVASLGIIVGTIAVIISLWLFIYFFLFLISAQ